MAGARDQTVFTLDRSGIVVSLSNDARNGGFDELALVGKHHSAFYTEEERASGKPDRVLAIAAAEGRMEDEGVRLRPDGTRFLSHLTLTRLAGADGATVGFAGVVRDLTATRATEDTFLHRARLLAETRALVALGSWEWDIATDAVIWTDELHEIFGGTVGGIRLEGIDSYLSFVHPTDRDRVRATIEEALRRGGWFDHEERIIRADGEERVLRSRGHAIVDAEGRVVRMAGSCIDITELRRAHLRACELAREQAARAAAESLARGLRFLVRASELLTATHDYEAALADVAWLSVPEIADFCAVDLMGSAGALRRFVTADVDPVRLARTETDLADFGVIENSPIALAMRTGRVQVWKEMPDEALRVVARSPEHLEILRNLGFRSVIIVPLRGRRGSIGALTLVHAESGRKFSENDVWVARELARHIALAVENSRLHRVLEERNLILEEQATELEARAIELRHQAFHLESVMGELERANDALSLRTAEAEAANRAKADFLATMSHELRTPLNAIVGYTDLLDLGLHGPVTRPQREALARIKHNQRSLLALINDVLHFAKLEAGRVDLAIADIPVRGVIRDLDVVIEPRMRAKGLRYAYHLCAGNPRVRGDQERIEQVLLNLLTNAIKFTASGGAIVLAVELEPSAVRFSVSDTGRGVPPDRLDSIFDPFVQIERAPEELRERGVGLGLAISRDLAHAMGGSLSVESRLGEGSTFALTLPRAG